MGIRLRMLATALRSAGAIMFSSSGVSEEVKRMFTHVRQAIGVPHPWAASPQPIALATGLVGCAGDIPRLNSELVRLCHVVGFPKESMSEQN
jgi:hypothetical protein